MGSPRLCAPKARGWSRTSRKRLPAPVLSPLLVTPSEPAQPQGNIGCLASVLTSPSWGLENPALLLPSKVSSLSLICLYASDNHLKLREPMTKEGTGRCWEAGVLGVSPSPAAESFVRVFGQHTSPYLSPGGNFDGLCVLDPGTLAMVGTKGAGF